MKHTNQENVEQTFLGDLEPLSANRARAELDRRQISGRWLGGSFLTGLASVFLMGGALYAALDGRQQLAIPAQAYQRTADAMDLPDDAVQMATKGSRPVMAIHEDRADDSGLILVSTISHDGEQDVVRLKPFMHLATPLAVATRRDFDYPRFDPLAIFSETGEAEPIASSADLIYGADVEGEISLKTEPFPFGEPSISSAQRQTPEDIEAFVRDRAPELSIGATALSSISYFDPARFSTKDTNLLDNPALTITAENVSVLSRTETGDSDGKHYEERFARVRSESPIDLVLQGEGFDEPTAQRFAEAIASNLASGELRIEDRLRTIFEIDNSMRQPLETPVRVSVYRGGSHLVSVAAKENGELVYASAPDPVPQQQSPSTLPALLSRNQMPNVYDAIYRAAMNIGMTQGNVKQLIRILAFDVDFKSRVTTRDAIELFMSIEEGQTQPTDESEILYARLKLGDTERQYYRFRDQETGVVGYYDESGKSAKQFLLRQPVPNGRFRSPFGMRRHPITRVMKMHTGVDFSARRGTPILAAGDGVVEKAGWAGGYGRQTIIRHANGYKTSYNHQTAFAKGVKSGARVRQGQVIGYVGSTGLSTGPHLHYEVLVNGNHVNPMKIKLPRGKVFRGEQLASFEAERDRIDNLLTERREDDRMFATN